MIVVIAILATITVVAYNGIQKRAYTTTYAAAANEAAKAVGAKLAIDPDLLTRLLADRKKSPISFCATKAVDLPAEDGFEAGSCTLGYAYNDRADDELFDLLFSSDVGGFVSRKLPSVSNSIIPGDKSRGIKVNVYDGEPRPAVVISWGAPDASSCGMGSGRYGEEDLSELNGTLEKARKVLNGEMTREEAGLDESLTDQEIRDVLAMYSNGLSNRCYIDVPQQMTSYSFYDHN